jgi:2,5-diamino-6-(ribosylamino)-4(3H)-pyrimidinone 5'-phosphate reductase
LGKNGLEEQYISEVIIHNSISLDGSLTNFQPRMGLHYAIARNYQPDIHLIGSNTVQVGVTLYGNTLPQEEEKDFHRLDRDHRLPYWMIPDTRGLLKGILHTCRRFEFCKDVIILVSETTPKEYVDYLAERNYAYHVVGRDHVDLKEMFRLFSEIYRVKKTLADTGRILSNLLLESGLVSEISLLVHPVIVGESSYNIFGNIRKNINLKLEKKEIIEKKYIWLVYKIAR